MSLKTHNRIDSRFPTFKIYLEGAVWMSPWYVRLWWRIERFFDRSNKWLSRFRVMSVLLSKFQK